MSAWDHLEAVRESLECTAPALITNPIVTEPYLLSLKLLDTITQQHVLWKIVNVTKSCATWPSFFSFS